MLCLRVVLWIKAGKLLPSYKYAILKINFCRRVLKDFNFSQYLLYVNLVRSKSKWIQRVEDVCASIRPYTKTSVIIRGISKIRNRRTLLQRWTKVGDVITQSRRAVIYPGFLCFQAEIGFSNSTCPCLPDGQKTWLYYGPGFQHSWTRGNTHQKRRYSSWAMNRHSKHELKWGRRVITHFEFLLVLGQAILLTL